VEPHAFAAIIIEEKGHSSFLPNLTSGVMMMKM
jgi:hypothetical protein